MTGKIFAVVGPSGAGKDTLIDAALANNPNLFKARRVITRPSDAGGEDFEGVSETNFLSRQDKGEFILSWQAHGLWYGIPTSVKTVLDQEQDVIFNGSRTILLEAQDAFENFIVIHVTASPETLTQRLSARGRETLDQICNRLKRANFEIAEGMTVRTVLNDGSLDQAIADFNDALYPSN